MLDIYDRNESDDIFTATSDGKLYKNGVLVEKPLYAKSDYKPEDIVPLQEGVEQVKPTLSELLFSVEDAFPQLVASGFALISKEEKERRLSYCKDCFHLSSRGYCYHVRLLSGEIEKGCGCYMPIKVQFAAMVCPVGKW